jgi:hypothetical protein
MAEDWTEDHSRQDAKFAKDGRIWKRMHPTENYSRQDAKVAKEDGS